MTTRSEAATSGSSGRRAPQEARHHAGDALPVLRRRRQLPAAGPRDRVELRPSVVLGAAPRRRNPAAMLEAQERGVDGSLVQLQRVVADLLDAARDAVAVQGAHALERLQDHQIERALKDIRPCVGAGASFGHAKGVLIRPTAVNRRAVRPLASPLLYRSRVLI